jgi:2-polyprenyl-6-methoxyphenol hydroxylase-like FAD-dependent oxidoreductase
MNPDVLIAGAGPVGLAAAAELTRYGLSVRIVDLAPQPTDKSKALVVWPRTLEHLQRLSLADTFVASGRRATRARFFQAAQELASVPLDSIDTQFPFGLMIPQSETERILTEHLASQGVHVERPVTLETFSTASDSVISTLTRPGGSETVTSRWLIGADGAHSAVRRNLNATFAGETLPSDWVLADVHIAGPLDPAAVELHLHADGVLGLFPIPPDRYRIIANVGHGGSATQPDPTLADLQSILDRRDPRGLVASNPVWLSAFHINERSVSNFRHGQIFLAGDAAHIHSPAGGQGMNTGMQDAFNLAWKLALVHHGNGPADFLLDSYSAERAPIAAQVLQGSGLLTRLGTLDNAVLRSVRNVLLRAILGTETTQHLFAENVSELAVHYPHSPLNRLGHTLHRGPKPGERAPIRPGDLPVSAGSSPQVTLFAAPTPETSTLVCRFPTLLDPTPRPPFDPTGIWLVRPDGYIAVSAAANEWQTLDAYLSSLTPPRS